MGNLNLKFRSSEKSASLQHALAAIRSQPNLIDRIVNNRRSEIERCAYAISARRKLVITGLGSSFYAAQMGEIFFRLLCPQVEVVAIDSFQLTLAGPKLSGNDVVIVISHSASTHYSLEALSRAMNFGAFTVLITSDNPPLSNIAPSLVIETVEQENASSRTLSTMASATLILAIASLLSQHRNANATLTNESLARRVNLQLLESLQLEEDAIALAEAMQKAKKVWIVGASLSTIVAKEIALKMQQACVAHVEGHCVEYLLQGTYQQIDAEDVVVLIANESLAYNRFLALGRFCNLTGAYTALLSSDEFPELSAVAQHKISFPGSSPPLVDYLMAPLQSLCFLQLVVFHYAYKKSSTECRVRTVTGQHKTSYFCEN